MWEAVLDVINKQEPSTCLSLVLGYGAVSGCEYCATFYYFLLVFVNFPLPGCVWFAGFQGGSLSLFWGFWVTRLRLGVVCRLRSSLTVFA